jgi:hypothetical protein
MNLPSSLALPQSKLLRSRVGILILVAAAALIGGVAFFVLRAPAPPKLPTPATSPAAQALPRSVVRPAVPAVPANAPGMYGPPAPAWVKRDLSVLPKPVVPPNVASNVGTTAAPVAPGTVVPPPAAGAPTTVAATPTAVAPGATVPGPAVTTATVKAPPVPAPTTAAVPAPATAVGTVVAASPATGTTTLAPSVPVPGAVTDETPKALDANTLFQREQYVYPTTGRRDPFQSLIDGRFESQSGDGSLVDVGDIHLVGIMWGSSDKFALVEDSRGRGFVLRVGDPVVNGYIAGISKTELQVVQNAFGDSQTVTIQLKSKEGDPNATRNQ